MNRGSLILVIFVKVGDWWKNEKCRTGCGWMEKSKLQGCIGSVVVKKI